MKKLMGESGQALMATVLCMSCLIGFAALATDVGVMLHERRLAQSAADSAAIAGALELNSGNWTSSAQAAAKQNGFDYQATGTTVAVNNPPSIGPYAVPGGTSYVEVIITQNQPTFFMKIFNLGSVNVSARAVASNAGASNGCVYALSPTGTGVSLQGSFDFSAPNCGIIIDSTDPAALSFTGNAGSLFGGSVGVVGGCSGTCTFNPPKDTPVTTGIVAQSDPLSYLLPSFPTPTGCTVPNAGGKKGAGILTGTVTPAGGTVCYSGDVTISNATLNAGMYIFTGNVTLDGTVTGSGVTLDLASTSGSLSENSNTTVNLVAPTGTGAGTFHDIAIMAPNTNTGGTLNFDIGNATGTIEGIIYAPDATLTLQDNGAKKKGGLSLITDLIVGSVDSGPSTFSITSYSQTVPGSPLTKVALVE